MAFTRNLKTTEQPAPEPQEAKPTYLNALVGREGKDGKAYFTKIGAAFPAKNGDGWNLVLDALPIDGRIFLRTPSDKSDEA